MGRSPQSKRKTIKDLVREYFEAHPNEDLPHGPVVDWVTEQWKAMGHQTPPRDPWRVDHIKPRHLGGKSVIENGQTLCAPCNLRKKRYRQTETGKRMFIRLLEIATKEQDQKMIDFCREVLQVYEKHRINDHIEWSGE